MQPAGLDSLNTQSLFSVIQPWLPFPIGSPTNPTTFACLGFLLCQIQRFLFSALKCFESREASPVWVLAKEQIDHSKTNSSSLCDFLFYNTHFCWTQKTQDEAAEMLFSFMPDTCLLLQDHAK